jgi:hypothetical protein
MADLVIRGAERDEVLVALSRATPGPWRVDERVGVVAVYAGDQRNCLEDGGDEVFRIAGTHDDRGWHVDPQTVADARAIVACVNALRDA